MKARAKKNRLKSEKGLATVEIVPLIFVFVFLLSYTMGAFGIIHTGIKNSISSRAYAFETFRNRSSLVYFRDVSAGEFLHQKNFNNRVHGVSSEHKGNDYFDATERPIRIGIAIDPDGSRNNETLHNERIPAGTNIGPGRRNTQLEVSPAWITIQYGMCLNNSCGD